jgi:hypothetical protein
MFILEAKPLLDSVMASIAVSWVFYIMLVTLIQLEPTRSHVSKWYTKLLFIVYAKFVLIVYAKFVKQTEAY